MSTAAPSTGQAQPQPGIPDPPHARLHEMPAGEATLEPTPSWHDPKRHAWLLGLVVPTLPFITWGLVEATGLGAFWFFGPVLVFGIFPLLDLAIGMDARNPPDGVIKWLEQDRYYRWCTYLYLPVQYAGLVLACWLFAKRTLRGRQASASRSPSAWSAAIAINTAHELGHKRASLERWLSRVALAQSGYGHFFIEHNRGHHVRVATPEDPAELAPRRDLLRLPSADRRRQPALGLGARARATGAPRALAAGRRATTSSARGR